MPDPLLPTDPLASKFPPIAPAQPTPRSVVGSMIAPIASRPTESRPAPVAPPPQGNTAQFMQLVRAHESGGNDRASSGVADGRYQFTPQTWAGVTRAHPELGLRPNDIWDGAKQDLAMRAISQDYINTLKVNGIPPTMPNMFMLHFLGVGGGPKFLKQMAANPNADAAAAFPLEAKYNPTIFHEKNGQSRSLAQVYALMTKTFGGPQAPVVDPRTATEPPTPAGMEFSPTAEMTANAQPASAAPDYVQQAFAETPVLNVQAPGTDLPDYVKKAFAGEENANPYAVDASTLKPDDKGYDVVGVDPNTGNPIYADPNKTEEFLKQQGEDVKGLLAGAAQDITGPASLIPPPPGSPAIAGGAAERLNKYLSETGDPTARKIGQILPMLAPVGEVAGAAKGGMKAFEAGESLVPSMLKGLGFGSATGALSESSNPSGKDTYSEQIAAKAPSMMKGAAEGAALGAILPGGLGLGAKGAKALVGEGTRLGRIIRGSAGKEADAMAEELRTGVNVKTGEALSAENRAAHIAALERFAEKAKLAQHEDELKKITDAQAQLAERERVRAGQNRDARQVDDPKAAEKLREGVTARARERVRQAEDQAKAAGATEEQAKGYAVEQEQKVLDAKNAAQEIAANYTKNPSAMTKEKFGETVQKAAADMEAKAEEAREVAADFKGAMRTAPPGPVVKNDKVFSILDDIDASSADRSVHAITAEVRKQFQTWRRDAEGNWEVADKNGITVERADSLRKVLNTALRSRKMAVEGGSADASAAQYHIGKVLDALEDATGTAHPPYNAAVKAWRDNSRGPLDEFLPKEALGKITKTQDLSGRFAMNEGRVVTEILSQSNAGSNALAVLAKEDKNILAATEQYLDRQLLGLEGRNTPTAKSVAAFMDKNESTLKKLGLYDKYAAMRDKLVSAGKEVEGAETTSKAAKDAASKAETQRKALEGVVEDRRSVLERSKKEQPGSVFSLTEEKVKDVAKTASDKASKDAKRLTEKAAGPKAAKSETESNIKALASQQTKAITQKKDFEEFESSLKSVAPRKAPAAAQSAAEALHKKGYITKGELDEVNRKVADIEKKYKEADWADRIRHVVIYPLATGVFGTLTGLSVHEYLSTRARAP